MLPPKIVNIVDALLKWCQDTTIKPIWEQPLHTSSYQTCCASSILCNPGLSSLRLLSSSPELSRGLELLAVESRLASFPLPHLGDHGRAVDLVCLDL